jgi:hypothetical protein
MVREMYICFVCGKTVTEDDEFIWHGLDGDKIHKRCEKNLQNAYDCINNMTDEEFNKYLLGE